MKVQVITKRGYQLDGQTHAEGTILDLTGPLLDAALHFKQVAKVGGASSPAPTNQAAQEPASATGTAGVPPADGEAAQSGTSVPPANSNAAPNTTDTPPATDDTPPPPEKPAKKTKKK